MSVGRELVGTKEQVGATAESEDEKRDRPQAGDAGDADD
jgi:hypothetical protein